MSANPEIFDPSKIISSRPWFDKAIEAVAPSWGKQRLQSRVETALFSYKAAMTNRLYAPKTYGQPSESTQTSRSRVVMMWEARDLVENFPEAREITRKFGNYLTPNEYSPTTGDRNYNQVVSEFFHEWCKRCDVTGRHTFKKLVQLGCEERAVDVSAQHFCDYFDPFRVDQFRGSTDFHAAIQPARMLYAILEAEKAGVR